MLMEAIGLVLILVLIAVTTSGGFYLVVRFIFLIGDILYFFKEWLDTKKYNRIKFTSFISFYNINSENWVLFNHSVGYKIVKIKMIQGYGYTDSKTTEFGFSLIDEVRYIRWKAQSEINKNKRELLEEYQEVLNHIKQDIEKINRENEQMIEKEAEKYTENVYSLFM